VFYNYCVFMSFVIKTTWHYPKILKYIFFAALNLMFADIAKCQNTDTTIVYYKEAMEGFPIPVALLDSADFIRIITPPDSGDNRRNVRDYYKSGKIKLIGKADTLFYNDFNKRTIRLTGESVTFFENGKRQSIVKWDGATKVGMEYLFYLNGNPYCTMKHGSSADDIKTLFWECFDSKGIAICKEGNGQWLVYDKNFKDIVRAGPVKKGVADGEWHGKVMSPDSIKYTAIYKNDLVVSGVGYDKEGTAYPYKKEIEKADYKQGPIVFINVLKDHLIVPRGPDGKKVSLDSVVVTFVVEKDGNLSHQVVTGTAGPELKDALLTALAKCKNWLPARNHGIPLRTEVFLPLEFIAGFEGKHYAERMFYMEKVLGF